MNNWSWSTIDSYITSPAAPVFTTGGPFVIIDDVVIFTGTVLLPTLDRSQLDSLARPLIRAGIRVDRKTVLIKLIESHHPIARATQVAALSLLAGMMLVVLEQLPW